MTAVLRLSIPLFFASLTMQLAQANSENDNRTPGAVQGVERVSIATDGAQGNSFSLNPALSADGNIVVFYSGASNLTTGDTNGKPDILVHDRLTGITERISIANDGTQGNGRSQKPAINVDGDIVAFESFASNLVAGDINGTPDIHVRDRRIGVTERVSIAAAGVQANGASLNPAISADGDIVAFQSAASNLVPGDTNITIDIFVRDRSAGVTDRVSITTDGAEGNGVSQNPAVSANGKLVAFRSFASNLVAGDTNGVFDIFVHDRMTYATERVSIATDGAQGNGGSFDPILSADGKFVAFRSYADNLVPGDTNGTWDIFVHNRMTGVTERVSIATGGAQGNGGSFDPALSADGNIVTFHSDAGNLVAGDTNGRSDIFVHDRTTGATKRVGVAADGAEGNSASEVSALSADGSILAYQSLASNLVAGDTNGIWDIFVHDRTTGATVRVGIATDGAQGNEIRPDYSLRPVEVSVSMD